MTGLICKGWTAVLFFCAVVAAVGSGQTMASECKMEGSDAMHWLAKMSRGSHRVDYHGVVTFQRGDDMQVMQISHAITNGSSTEQMTQLTGQGAQIVRQNHPLECVHPGHHLLRADGETSAGGCGITDHYRLQVDAGERIAGRKAMRIRVDPLDMYRYGYIMDLDKETGLLLKVQTIGRGNKVLERFQFASLSLGTNSKAAANPELVHKATHPVVTESSAVAVPASRWAIQWLPGGFTATDSQQGAHSRRTYTDGLAVFSVFLERLPKKIKAGEGVARHGGTTSYTRGMRLKGKPVLVTVIGEVPLNTARMVADSLSWTY
ncbi:MAG: negative regulator for alginate biosynthesis [Halieaceae bacterium]|nr:negative regulator for alginate biosynthesis [Halieaceae bacterium]